MPFSEKSLRVGFVLCSSTLRPIPSTRIAVVNVLPYLKAAGLDPFVVFEPISPSETPNLIGVFERIMEMNCDVVVMQKVRGPSALTLVQKLEKSGIRTIFSVCDVIDAAMVRATSGTAIVTEYLRSLHPFDLQSRIHVVHDGIERPDEFKTEWSQSQGRGGHPLTAVLVTSTELTKLHHIVHPPSWLRVRVVGKYEQGKRRMRQARWTFAALEGSSRYAYLRFLFDARIQCVPWHADHVYSEMLAADLAILPIDTFETLGVTAWKLKSENRLTMKMSMALPVIATPIPSYEGIIEHGVTGFFARSSADWKKCLDALRDPDRRKKMGLAAREAVSAKFAIERQSKLLTNLITAVCPQIESQQIPH